MKLKLISDQATRLQPRRQSGGLRSCGPAPEPPSDLSRPDLTCEELCWLVVIPRDAHDRKIRLGKRM